MSTMTAKELSEFIGRHGLVKMGTLFVEVKVSDARISYGRIQLKVLPTGNGTGYTWIMLDSIHAWVK